MRTLFILCTAVTVLQIFDVSITGVLSAGQNNNAQQMKQQTTVTRRKKTIAASPSNPNTVDPAGAGSIDPANSNGAIDPNNANSKEVEPPKTLKESGKRTIATLKQMATNQGVGVLNGFTGLLKISGSAFNFFGSALRDRSNNVKDVAKKSLELVGSFSDSSTRGVSNLMDSGATLAAQGGKELGSALQKMTKLGTNAVKFGGTVISTPITMAEDFVGTANRLAKIPSLASKNFYNRALKPLLGVLGKVSDEEQSEEDTDNKST